MADEPLQPGWTASFISSAQPKDAYFSNIQLQKELIAENKWRVTLTAPQHSANAEFNPGSTIQGEYQLSEEFKTTSDLNASMTDLKNN